MGGIDKNTDGSVSSSIVQKELLGRMTLDEAFKRLLAMPEVLAPILYQTVDEFEGCSLEEVCSCIRCSAIDGSVDVLNLEDYGAGEESLVMYDSLITADISQISGIYANVIIDTEMQHDKPQYPLENRAQYYVARLLSGQLRSVHKLDGYGGLVPVYTIWIVREPYAEQRNTVHRFVFRNSEGSTIKDCSPKAGNLMHVIMVNLPEAGCESEDELLKFLMAVFTRDLAGSSLTRLIREKQEAMEGVEVVMTLEEAVMEKGMRRGMERGGLRKLVEMVCRKMRKGKPAVLIADELEEDYQTVADICEIAQDFGPDYDEETVWRKYLGE